MESAENRNNKCSAQTILYVIVLTVGLIAGAAIQNGSEVREKIAGYAQSLVESRLASEPINLFISSVVLTIVFELIMLITGISRSIRIFSYPIMLMLGIGYGAILAFLISRDGIYSLGTTALILIPGLAASIYAIILSARLIEKNKEKHMFSKLGTIIELFVWTVLAAGLDVACAEIYKLWSV